jgi:hypothetical protein
MKTLYIHIGIGKTGTTAIQNFFTENKEQICSQGLFYPEIGKRGTGHHELTVFKKNKLPLEKIRLFNKLINNISKIKEEKILISSEFFCFMQENLIEDIANLLVHLNIKIIFYIRKQIHLIESAFLQFQKIGKEYNNYIEEFFEAHKTAFNFSYRIQPWAQIFGKENIIARLYEPQIVGEDVREDILNVMDVNFPVIRTKYRDNPSLLPEFSKIITIIDKHHINSEDRINIVAQLIDLSAKFKSLSVKDNFTDLSFKQKVYRYYEKSNLEFAQGYLTEQEKKILCG